MVGASSCGWVKSFTASVARCASPSMVWKVDDTTVPSLTWRPMESRWRVEERAAGASCCIRSRVEVREERREDRAEEAAETSVGMYGEAAEKAALAAAEAAAEAAETAASADGRGERERGMEDIRGEEERKTQVRGSRRLSGPQQRGGAEVRRPSLADYGDGEEWDGSRSVMMEGRNSFHL